MMPDRRNNTNLPCTDIHYAQKQTAAGSCYTEEKENEHAIYGRTDPEGWAGKAEASGIALSCMAAQYFRVPVLFAKKAKSRNLDNDLYTAVARSYTYGIDNTLTVSKRFLTSDDHVLIMDDFLANGNAVSGLLELCAQAGASVAGIANAIEKGYQGGGDALRSKGYDVFSLAIIDEMNESGIRFR